MAMVGTTSAQSVTVSDVEAVPGETVKATLDFTCPANIYTGMKITLVFPSTKFAINDVTTATGSIGVNTDVAGQVTYTYAVTNAFTSASFNVEFVVDNTVDVSEEGYEVTISGQLEGEEGSTAVKTPITGSFKVKVVNAHIVTLSEDAEEVPAAATGVNAHVLRTIKGGNWSTICLPFAISEEKMVGAFGEGVIVRDFMGYDYDKSADEIKVKFSTVKSMEANRPYIIKVASDINEFTVEQVDIAPVEEPWVSYESGDQVFKGTFVVIESIYKDAENTPLFISGNNFYYAAKKGTQALKAFRGYFDFADEVDMSRIGMIADEETGIDNVTYQSDGEFYNLRGQRVETPAKGVYIKDGKKVVVK